MGKSSGLKRFLCRLERLENGCFFAAVAVIAAEVTISLALDVSAPSNIIVSRATELSRATEPPRTSQR